MTKETIRVTSLVPASPHEIYDAWLESSAHGEMTGGIAVIDPRVGGRHTAWDGYIEGEILELQPDRLIVQSWRSADFPDDAEHSCIEVSLEPYEDQTRVAILHRDIPEGQGKSYQKGWVDNYFKPMAKYFAAIAARDVEPRTEAMPAIVFLAPAREAAPDPPPRPAKKKAKPAPKKAAAKAGSGGASAKPSAKKTAPKAKAAKRPKAAKAKTAKPKAKAAKRPKPKAAKPKAAKAKAAKRPAVKAKKASRQGKKSAPAAKKKKPVGKKRARRP